VLASELCRNGFCPHWRSDRAHYAPSDFCRCNFRVQLEKIRDATRVEKNRLRSAELAPDPISQQALRFLRDRGELVELSAEVVLQTEQFVENARCDCRLSAPETIPAPPPNYAKSLGTSRRVIIPFLERLDRERCYSKNRRQESSGETKLKLSAEKRRLLPDRPPETLPHNDPADFG